MMGICRKIMVCCLVGLSCQVAAYSADTEQMENDKSRPTWPLFALCMDTHDAKKRTLPQQAEMLKELGYAGCGHLWPDNADARAETLETVELRLFQVYVKVDLAQPKPLNEKALAGILPALRPHRTQLALLMTGGSPSDSKQDDQAVAVITRIADMARPYGVEIVLYPHTGDWLQTLGDAVRLAKKVNRPGEVGAMFNLCHWMKADSNRSLRAVLQRAQPWLMAVSLSGSDAPEEVRAGKGNWIQPLGQGTYDVLETIETLRELNYAGPVGLQCWGIEGDARTHLEQSIKTWNRMVQQDK